MSDEKIPVSLKRALHEILGEEGLRLGSEDLEYYGQDRCKGSWPVKAGAIALPKNTQELQALVKVCAEHAHAMVPSGGRTGLTGAATATSGELVVSMSRMSKIIAVDAVTRTIRCQAGVTVEAIQEAAAAVGLLYPIDFAAKGSAQIGGTVATNAGGVKVIHYGSTRAWVRGLQVVLASGACLQLGGALVKDNTGYDLRQLLIGSEGTLGLISEVTLALCRPAAARKVVLCSLASDAAVLRLFTRLRASELTLSAFECFDHACVERVRQHRRVEAGPFEQPAAQYVLMEVICEDTSLEETMGESLMEQLLGAQDAEEILDAQVASTSTQEEKLWAWREEISESLHQARPHKADISLPIPRVSEFMKQWRQSAQEEIPAIPALIFGHIGDGNLHLNLLCPEGMEHSNFQGLMRRFDERTYGMVEAFSGSISAEHGIGLLKRDHLHHSRTPAEIELMRGIKKTLDPQGLLNPGKLI